MGNYALSLMRAHNAEHSDSLPVIDVSAMKHIAYVFDALIYYMRSGTEAIGDANHTISVAPITVSQGISAVSILRNSTTPNTLAVGSSNLNVATYGDENEPDDPNDDSLMEENSQSGNHQ